MNISILKSDRLEDRIDVTFYSAEYFKTVRLLASIASNDKNYELAEIRNILSKDEKDITGGATPFGAVYLEEGIPFIRVQNVRKNKMSLDDVKFIPKFIHETDLKRSQLKPNDVLLTITGMTYGLSAVVQQELREANMNQHSVRIRINEDKILPKYLSIFLNSKLGKIQSDRFVTGSTRPALDYESVRSIKIIFPKSISEQEKIVSETEKYLDISERKLDEFKQVISYCISLVSRKLNIRTEKRKSHVFLLNAGKTNLSRFDCYSHSPEYHRIVSDLRNAEKQNKCKLVRGGELGVITDMIDFDENSSHIYKYIDIGNTEKDFGFIYGYEEDVLLNLPSRARHVIMENDVLIPRPIGSTGGIIIVPKEYDGQLCSTGFIQIRPKKHDDAILLWGILKNEVVQEQMFYLQSGSLQPEVTPQIFMNRILIPIPRDDIKNDIIKEIKAKFEELVVISKEREMNEKRAEEVFIKKVLNK